MNKREEKFKKDCQSISRSLRRLSIISINELIQERIRVISEMQKVANNDELLFFELNKYSIIALFALFDYFIKLTTYMLVREGFINLDDLKNIINNSHNKVFDLKCKKTKAEILKQYGLTETSYYCFGVKINDSFLKEIINKILEIGFIYKKIKPQF